MKKFLLVKFLTLFSLALRAQFPEPGQWQGMIEYEDEDVPFEFRVENEKGQPVITIENGDEKIRIDNTTIEGDSIVIPLKPFDAWIKAKVNRHLMEGFWRKGYRSKGIPFKAHYGVPRFERGNKKGLK
ncbi:MAG: hypothetical protein AAGG59_17480, partial [Bacteroidota bacterium]